MSLRVRLLAAAVACLAVVSVASLVVAQRQERVLGDQLDTQLTLYADRLLSLATDGAVPATAGVADTGEVFIGGVEGDTLIAVAVPASTPNLAPALDSVRSVQLGEPVTVATSADGVEMRVIVQEVDGRLVVVGQSTESIEEAVRSLWVSGGVAIAAIAGFFVLVGWWVNQLGIGPIRDATEVARAITLGRRDERVEVTRGSSEAATLGTAMNLMLDTTAQTEARLRSFVADASHELRTPLTSLIGYADLRRQGLLASEDAVDDAMRRIRAEALRMSTIVEHLFVLANFDEATTAVDRQHIDVDLLLSDIASDARAASPHRAITVEAPGPLEVVADPNLVLQAISAFVSNALVHTPVTATLTLRAATDADSVTIAVEDSGPGIKDEHLGRVFDRFYRVDPGRARPGSGLGLAIARAIAEAHGGSVDVESTVGVGSTFCLRLPRFPV